MCDHKTWAPNWWRLHFDLPEQKHYTHIVGGNIKVLCYTNMSRKSAVASCDISNVTLASDQAQLTWQHICQAEVALVFDALQT